MTPIRNARVLFLAVPEGYPEAGKHIAYDDTETIDLESVPLKGGILVKMLIQSSDPYLRERMYKPEPGGVYFIPNFNLGSPVENFSISKVLRSEEPKYKPGDLLYCIQPFQEYLLYDGETLKMLEQYYHAQVLPKTGFDHPLSAFVGPLGMPGQTAYFGWQEFAEVKKGDVVYVNTAAGVVGSFVVQLAKKAGCKVIGSAGSEEKVEFVRSLGADVVFNYKTTSTDEVLRKEGPINIFWDNVGGDQLEYALDHSAIGARLLLCGWISGYNTGFKPIKNTYEILFRTLKVNGIYHSRLYAKHVEDFFKVVPQLVAHGEIKYREDFKHGLDKAVEAILDVQTGKNTGKSVIIVAKE